MKTKKLITIVDYFTRKNVVESLRKYFSDYLFLATGESAYVVVVGKDNYEFMIGFAAGLYYQISHG